MIIDSERCISCESCLPYCPVGAIRVADSLVLIDQDECVECEICQRSGVCPEDAFIMPQLEWPRVLRNRFSNPLVTHPDTQVPGRGTEEMKTNDVTGRFQHGRSGIAVELGRPGTGTLLRDVETIARAVARVGVRFEPLNPVTTLIQSLDTGRMQEEVLDERVLSAIVEFELPTGDVPQALKVLEEVACNVDTVFSVDLIDRVNPDGRAPGADLARASGYSVSENGKTCVGLGRPLREDEPT